MSRNDVLVAAAALGVVTGLRSLGGIKALAVEQHDDASGWLRAHPFWRGRPHQPIADALRSDLVTKGLRGGMLAAALARHLPDVPERVDPLPLLGRAALGALTGAAAAELAGADRALPIVVGAAAAALGTWGSWHARRWLIERRNVPEVAVSLGESALAWGAGRVAAKRLTG